MPEDFALIPKGSRLVASTLRRGHESRRVSPLRRCLHEVFAVVQNQEQTPSPRASTRVSLSGGRDAPVLQSPRHLLSYQFSLGERRKLHQPHSVRVDADEIPGHLERQSGLARAPAPVR